MSISFRWASLCLFQAAASIARVSFSVWLKPQIKQMLEREAFDVVHFHEPFAGLISKDILRLVDPALSTAVGTFHTYEGNAAVQDWG